MRVSWCRSCGGGSNFGDVIGPQLLMSGGKAVEWAPPDRAEIITAGSTLSKVPNGWTGTVLGTGFIREGLRKDLRRARVLAVRGAHTRRTARGAERAVLGDPGVLAPDIYRVAEEARPPYELIIPHYVDKEMAARHPDAWVGDICGDPVALMSDIAHADIVYTSSLHALIAADSLGVPHVLEPHPSVIGGMFKFRDYASAFDEDIVAGRARVTPRPAMEQVQSQLRALFASL